MARYTIEVEDELVEFFETNVGLGEPAEVMLVKMLKLLKALLITANNTNSN